MGTRAMYSSVSNRFLRDYTARYVAIEDSFRVCSDLRGFRAVNFDR